MADNSFVLALDLNDIYLMSVDGRQQMTVCSVFLLFKHNLKHNTENNIQLITTIICLFVLFFNQHLFESHSNINDMNKLIALNINQVNRINLMEMLLR